MKILGHVLGMFIFGVICLLLMGWLVEWRQGHAIEPAVAAAEAAVGLGIVIALFRNRVTVDVDDIHLLKW